MNLEPSLAEAVDRAVDAFESAYAVDPTVDCWTFAPMASDPHCRQVIAELVRVDMELSRRRGKLRRLDDYLACCPMLLGDLDAFKSVMFEEYRQRRLAGEAVDP